MADSRMDLILKKLNGEDVELVPPMSRIEKIYFKLLGYDIELDPPQSRSEVLLTEYVNNGGGGDITVEPLSVTENNTYTAPTGKAYSPVTVNVSGGGGGESEYGYIYVQNTTATSVDIYTCRNDANGNSVQNGTRVTIASGDTGTIPLTYQSGNTTRVNAVMRIRCSSWTTASALTVTGTSTVYTYKIGVGVGTAERNAFAYVNEVVGYTVVLGG